jgi:DNA polymerase alpha subunit A
VFSVNQLLLFLLLLLLFLDSSSDEEFVPTTTDLSVSFPEPAPESALNQLQINNILAMEIDMEVDEEDQVFLDEADLNQFEQEMSFILEDQDKTDVKAVDVVGASDNKNVTLEPSSSFASDNKNVTLEASSALNDTDGSILFYWFDAYERQPNGPVHLFGKMQDPRSPTGTTTSCVIIENMQRNLYFLPRDNSTPFEDLQAEVSDIARQYGINKFGCKRVTRKYAFELPGIPSESEYLKLVYPFDSNPQLPLTLSGRTFSHVFGTNTGALEMFLIKRKIMGPSWLKLQPTSISGRTAISWCKSEIRVGDPKGIHALAGNDVPPPPLMTAMSVSLRTIMNPETRAHEIVSISGLVYDSVDVDGSRTCATDRPRCSAAFTVVRMDLEAQQIAQIPSTSSNIRVEPAKSEKALLNYFLAMLQRHDPDILIGHNFLGFDLGVLLHRMRNCKVDFWSKLGRLNWTHWPKSKGAASQQGGGSTEASYAERQILSGRIVCDTYLTAKDLVKAKNYSLGTLAASQLGLERTPFDYERVKEYFASPQLLREMLTGSEMDAYYAAMLMFQMLVLPLTLQLTNIAGNLWSRTLTGARAERNEFLLLHEFHNNKFICPDKQPFSSSAPSFTIGTTDNDEESATTAKSSTSSRRKPAYSGGLVLEPKKGFYDRIVLLLDFNSLYPSIIQEYNICFTTVERGAENNVAEERTGPNDVPPVPDSSLPQGVLPRILKTLVERRRAVKSMMKKEAKLSESQLASLNIRQQALKLTANSMYGCLGFSHSRFYAKPLAILITAKGREILQSTVNLTRDVCQSDVIYGDTDSIMVNTRTLSLVDARALGQKIKRTVNEHYRLLEIELDAVFQKLLLLKKKKYAALIVDAELPDGSLSTRLETKGLDLVRRDWCPLSVDASTTILNEIMYAHADPEEIALRVHESLRLVAQDLKQDKIPLEKFIISKVNFKY